MADANEIKDLAATLNTLISRLSESTNTIVDGFERSARSAGGLNNVLEEMVLNSGAIPKNIRTADELQKKLTTDTRLFARLEEEISRTQKDMIGKYYQRAVNEMYRQVEATEDLVEQARIVGTTMAGIHDIEKEVTEELKRQLELMQRQQETGAGIFDQTRDFVRAFDSGNPLLKLYDTYKKIEEFSSKPGGIAAIFLGTGLIAATKAVSGVVNLLKAAFMETYDFIDKKVMPTNAALNKELGNMGKAISGARSAAISTGVEFEKLGLDFGTGTQAVIKLHSAMMTTALSKETLNASLKLSEYIGLGAEQTGKLMLAFEKTGVSTKEVNATMREATKIAAEYGVPVNQIRRDMGENIDILARFGTANRVEMLKSAAQVRQYGLTIKEVNAAFGKTMDTFDKTSDTSAKLNATFGTNINSFELMMETNPEKRMAMVRKELDKQAISWEKLEPFEKNVLTATLGINDEQAQLAFASAKVRKELQAQLNEKKRLARVDQDWDKGMTNIKSNLLNMKSLLDNLLRSVADFVSKLLGFKDADTPVVETAKSIEIALRDVTKFIDGLNPEPIVELKDGFMSFITALRDVKEIVYNVQEAWEDMVSSLKSNAKWFAVGGPLGFLVKQAGGLVGADFAKSTAEQAASMITQIVEGGNSLGADKIGEMRDQLKNDPVLRELFEAKVKRRGAGVAGSVANVLEGAEIKAGKGNIASMTKQLEEANKTLEELRGKKGSISAQENLELVDIPKLTAMIEEQNRVNQALATQLGLDVTKINDGMITKNGEVVKFNPNDTILAIKDFVASKAGSRAGGSSTGDSGDVRVEIVDINMDGKKVGEAQFRISRN